MFGAISRRQLPRSAILTVADLDDRGLRLYFVVQALGFPDVELGISGALFVALIGSLLTAVPLSPAGLGVVEAGVVGVLTLAYGVPLPEATAIALRRPRRSACSRSSSSARSCTWSRQAAGQGPSQPVEASAPPG